MSTPAPAQPTNELTLPTKPFDILVGKNVFALILKLAPRKVASRIHKSLDHYTKALLLIGVDDEMGAIRCIAAEEELVVALFEWLKLNSTKVPKHEDFIRKFKNHYVKLAFYPVLSQFKFVLSDMLAQGLTTDGLEDVLRLNVRPECRDDKVQLVISDKDGKELLQLNPLSIAVNWNDRPEPEVVDELYKDFAQLVADQQNMTIKEFVTARAEYRNKLLYAEDGGYVMMNEDLSALIDTGFSQSLRDLLWCLAVLLSNDPVRKEWGLVSQFVALYRRALTEAKLI